MNIDAIKKRLEESRNPKNSQTDQSGFSASNKYEELKAKYQQINQPTPRYDEPLVKTDPNAVNVLSTSRAVEEGKRAWEDYKLGKTRAKSSEDEGVLERIGRYLAGSSGDTSLPSTGITDVARSKIEDPYKALEIGRLSDSDRDEFYARFNEDEAGAKEWAAERIEQTKQKETADLQNWAKEHPLIGNLTAVAPMRAAGADYLNVLTDAYAGTNFYDPNDITNPSAFMDAARAGAKEGSIFGSSAVGQFMDDVTFSTLQSYWSNLVSGGAANADKFSSLPLAFYSASSTARQLLLKTDPTTGDPIYTNEQAAAVATVHGVISWMTEALGSDRLIAKAFKSTKMGESTKAFAKRLAVTVAKSFLSEGSEEAAEDVLDWTIDAIIDLFWEKDASELSLYLADEYAAGYKGMEAVNRAWLRAIESLAVDALAGGISGGLMGGVGAIGGQVAEDYNAIKRVYEYTKTSDKSNLVKDINTVAKKAGDTSNPLRINKGMNNKVQNFVENVKVGKAMMSANRSIEVMSISDRLEQDGLSKEDARKTAEAIFRSARGGETTFEEDRLLKSETAQKVLQEYERSLDPEDSFMADWVKESRFVQNVYTSGFQGAQFSEENEDSPTKEFRTNELESISERLGLNAKTIASENADLSIEDYKTKLELAYSYGKAGYKLEDVARKLGRSVSGVFGKAYQRGLDARTEKILNPSARVGRATTTPQFVSQKELDAYSSDGTLREINLEQIKAENSDKAGAMEYFSAVMSSIFHRKVRYFSGGELLGGRRTANEIWVNVDAAFDDESNPGNVVGEGMHEFGHDIANDAPDLFDELKQITIDDKYGGDALAFDKDVDSTIRSRIITATESNVGSAVDRAGAVEEVVCDHLATLANNPDDLTRALEGHTTLRQKLVAFLKNLLGKLRAFIAKQGKVNRYASYSAEAVEKIVNVLEQYKERVKSATKTSAGPQTTEQTAKESYVETHEVQTYNIKYSEQHDADLGKFYNPEAAAVALDELKKRRDAIIDIWNEIGGELNSEFLNAWNNKKYTDRAFTIFKEQMGYKYAGELASMCKKGVPLFEAIDNIVREGIYDKLKKKVLGPAEKSILYDILKTKGFEIPCAICYVEQARRREGEIINKFVSGDVAQHKLGWNSVLEDVEKRMAKLGVNYKFQTAPETIMTDTYSPVDTTMSESEQKAFYRALMDACNEEIKYTNEKTKQDKKKKEEDKVYRPLLTGTTPDNITASLGGTLPTNLKVFKVLFQNPDARFKLEAKQLYNSQTTLNLSYSHHALYSLFNSQGGTSGYKTKQGTVVYAGDILSTTWDRDQMRIELGLRSQSNSDYQMYTLVDKMQMLVDLTAKGYYAHEYTKVISNLQLFGLSGIKQLASSIPAVHLFRNSDGTVDVIKTMESAGLDENGNPIFDTVEGIDVKYAFMLAADKNYSKNIGINCIGYSDKHIIALLNDPRISQVIGFHDKTNNPENRYVGAKYAKNYKGINEAKDASGTTVHLSFSEFIDKAEKAAAKDSSIDVPRYAAQLYLEHCAEKNWTPAYNIPGIVDHPNYYKLLCDFNLYDSEGNYAPMQRVAFNMPLEVPGLDANGNKITVKSEDIIRAELRKEITMREDLSAKMPSIMDEFLKRANAPKKAVAKEQESLNVKYTNAASNFYSQMGKVIESKNQTKFEARSLINMLLGNGVKTEEIKWSGIATFLEGKKSVTKEELVDFVNKSKLQIEETWLGEGEWNNPTPAMIDKAWEDVYNAARENLNNQYEIGILQNLYRALATLRINYDDNGTFTATANLDGNVTTFFKENPRINTARWGDYKYRLRGTENYREILLRMPGATYSNREMKVHWGKDASGILAHARIDDAWLNNPPTDPDTGEAYPMLFVEEIQSDWHNKGAKIGYKAPSNNDETKSEKISKLEKIINSFSSYLNPDNNIWDMSRNERITKINKELREAGIDIEVIYDPGLSLFVAITSDGDTVEIEALEYSLYSNVMNSIRHDLYDTKEQPPEAPFSGDKYVEFVMKKLLRTAAEEGYTKIGWTTAQQQIDRWSDRYEKAYRIEYDQEMPKFLNKYGKQWGARASHEELSNGQTVWTFPINEAMRKSLIYDGLPMYSVKHIDTKTTIKSGSLFSGGGLLEQGLEYQLLTHEFGVEYDASIAATWKENNGDGKIYAGKAEGNVFNFDGKQYKGKMFHIHASPVCHNLSPAKHGYGEQPSDIESAKKTLQIFLDAEAPVYTVENAELYAKTESARIIKEGLEKAGYIVDIGVYNSADYGSAQSRTRTIIRAVRGDLMMPDRARKIPRTRTWDQVTSDLWDGLERITEKEVPDFYLKAVKNTGIDINNVKVPTLLLQTTTGGKVTYAVEGTQSPTLTTHCYEAKLLLPGGVICNVTPQFMGRLMGLPDDFKYPHWKDGTLKKTIPYKIIGNGIPVELTKAVVGGVIESAYKQTMGTELYSIKHIDEFSLSPRQYLAAAALETIRDPADREELRKIIDEYQTLDDTKTDLERQIAKLLIRQDKLNADLQEIQQTLTKTSAAKSRIVTDLINRYGSTREAMSAIRTELKDIEKQLKNLRSEQGKVTARLHDILTMPRVESIIEEQRQLVREYRNLYQSTKEADKIKLQELRERMNQKIRAEIDKRIEMRKKLIDDYKEREKKHRYLPKLQKAIKNLETHVKKAPVPLRNPIYKFLSLIDFRTFDDKGNVALTRKVKGVDVPNEANIARQARYKEIEALLGNGKTGKDRTEGDLRKWFNDYGIQMSADVEAWIDEARQLLESQVFEQNGININTATADELQATYNLANALDLRIRRYTKAYTDVNLDMSEQDKKAAEHMDMLGNRKNVRVGAIEYFMRYANAQAPTVFDRLGEAGRTLFRLLSDAEAKRTFNVQAVKEFADKWDSESVRKWANLDEHIDVKLEVLDKNGNPKKGEYNTVTMTVAQAMALYGTSKDEAGKRHLLNGGFKLADIVKTVKGRKVHLNDEIRMMTQNDLDNLVAALKSYDPEIVPFVDDLQDFMAKTGAQWGNQVSIQRFGYEQFGNKNYFPLITVLAEEEGDVTQRERSDIVGKIFGLINKSFTKERQDNAGNPLIIRDIFDLFYGYMDDMALYNAYALPILDVMRFLQYKERDDKGNVLWSINSKMNNTYGTRVMQNYIEDLLVSINGQKPMSNLEQLSFAGLRLRNRVAVSMNIRVVIQQFFSIIRSVEVLPSKYFDFIETAKDFNKLKEEMRKYSGIALKKHHGYFGQNISRSLREEKLGSGNKWVDFSDAVTEKGMSFAEAMDTVAWVNMWNACRNWVRDTNPDLEGDAFLAEVDRRFSNVVYRTQVVDSVLQKSQVMRSNTFWSRAMSSFKGEPTTAYNVLLRQYDAIYEARQRGDSWGKILRERKEPLLRAFVAYALTALVNAVVTSIVDAARDDDDYETLLEKFVEAMFGEYKEGMTFKQKAQQFLRSNMFESFNPFSLPYLSEAVALFQGYDPSRPDLIALTAGKDMVTSVKNMVKNPNVKDVYKLLGGLSMISGLPGQNVFRDVVSIWNTIFGQIDHNVKLKISPESAVSGYEALYKAMSNGESVRAMQLVDDIVDNVGDPKKAYQGVTDQIRQAYYDDKISRSQAKEYLATIYDYFDYELKNVDTQEKLSKHFDTQIEGWDRQKEKKKANK